MVMFGEVVADGKEEEEDGVRVEVEAVETSDLEYTDFLSMLWTAMPKVEVKLTAAPSKVAFGAKVEKLSPGVKVLVVVNLVVVASSAIATAATAARETFLNCIIIF